MNRHRIATAVVEPVLAVSSVPKLHVSYGLPYLKTFRRKTSISARPGNDDAAVERFAQAAPTRSIDTGWTAGMMSAHRILGEVRLARGDLASAVEHLNASVAGARELETQCSPRGL